MLIIIITILRYLYRGMQWFWPPIQPVEITPHLLDFKYMNISVSSH
jgi:hypothetical protein